MSLTHKQSELLWYIQQFQDENAGVSPSFVEMKTFLGLRSASGIHRLVLALEHRGFISRIPGHARAITVNWPMPCRNSGPSYEQLAVILGVPA